MHRLHTAIIRPLLAAVGPHVLVEVGAGSGRLTARMLADAPEAEVHAIDPDPQFDAVALARENGSRLTLHHTTSEKVLGVIDLCDLAILDGDPNHQAVLSDLTALAALREPPVIVVHNTGWPFGRRDGFHFQETNPQAVPAGVKPGHKEPDPDGLQLVPFVAATDVGPENGVQRAVTRHLENVRNWSAVNIPGLHGSAILSPPQRLDAHEGLAPVLRNFAGPRFLAAQVRRVERVHLVALAEAGVADEETAVSPLAMDEQEADHSVEEVPLEESSDDQIARFPTAERDELIADAARLRGELEVTTRGLELAQASAADAVERAAVAQSARDHLDAVVLDLRRELDGLSEDVTDKVARVEALEAEREEVRSQLRVSREDAARRASEVDHLVAQRTDARAALEAFASERLLTRRQRIARVFGRLRSRRERDHAELASALQALGGQVQAEKPNSIHSTRSP